MQLRRKMIAGASWISVSLISAKIFGFGTQLALAYALVPEDFGLAAAAISIANFFQIATLIGIPTILGRYSRDLRDWSRSALIVSVFAGIFSAYMLMLLAPFAERLIGTSGLADSLTIVSVFIPFGAVCTWGQAALQAQLRFKVVSLQNITRSLLEYSLCILMAWQGYGAISILLPRFVTLAMLGCYYFPAGFRTLKSESPRRSIAVLRIGAVLSVGNLSLLTISQADYLLLSFFAPSATVGAYFLAFNLSTQLLALISASLSSVLLPGLSQHEASSGSQLTAYIKSVKICVMILVPLCYLQALLAPSLIALVDDGKWNDAATYLVILSLAVALRVPGFTAGTAMKAQGRFSTLTKLNVGYATTFMILISAGAKLFGVLGVAWSVVIFYFFISFTHLMFATKTKSSSLLIPIEIYRNLILSSIPFGGVALLIWFYAPSHSTGLIPFAIRSGLGVMGCVTYWWIWCRLDADTHDQFAGIASVILGRDRTKSGALNDPLMHMKD